MSRSQLKDEVFMNMAVELSRLGPVAVSRWERCCYARMAASRRAVSTGRCRMAHWHTGDLQTGSALSPTSHAEENAWFLRRSGASPTCPPIEPCLTCCRALVRLGVRR